MLMKEFQQHMVFMAINNIPIMGGAHHQNGIVENRIKLLTLKSRTMLLHVKRYWPEYIATMLWPYALKMAEVYCSKFDVDEDEVSPEERFSN
eukprot:7055789-Ditylum_brightwellii.AAC.1